MIDAVICSPLRTAVGRYGGQFRDVPAATLAETVIRALIGRNGIRSAEVDDVIFGQCYPNGEAPAIGRVAALDAGLGIGVAGMQLDRRCGSGLQAVITAAMQVQTGVSGLVVAGGVESMSQAEHYVVGGRFGLRGDGPPLWDRLARGRITSGGRHYPIPGGMIETAENLRRTFGIARAAQDALALSSHRRASAAQAAGRFADEIVPVEVAGRDGPRAVAGDEHIRHDASAAALAALSPLRIQVDPRATVTAGNASGQNDGAAACIVTSRDKAEALGLRPLARLAGWAVAGVEPERMGYGPVPAVNRVLCRAGLRFADIDLIELHEAFAVQVLACTAGWNFAPGDFDRLNVNGSGISLGHPAGATGARIMTTLLHEMHRRGARYGLEALCIGGGQGLAAVFERLD